MDYVIETFQGQKNIIIFDTLDGQPHNRLIPLTAVASWMELLGFTDPAVALNAIIHVQDNGEPECNYETGVNTWTGPYAGLTELLIEGHCPMIDQLQEQACSALGVDQVEAPIEQPMARRMARVFSPLELLHNELRDMDGDLGPLRADFLIEVLPVPSRDQPNTSGVDAEDLLLRAQVMPSELEPMSP